ncbi:CHAD domain-containing protein [Rhodoblastus acidophilus]|uniref:CHAD domain-containing protein n=1 Tax=Rhodoblastus acidophilus TaxID=1074 RepID=A0A6N8DTG8_RHOAC|nr:CHAD domain-containing protein [Rhodoblastus acidophilus]MCW2276190.1 inorganic triphosphatase YgiF [Rhodoblastus acidophilus]MTV32855.1 CHAD domain-containing protein [Rhodoblastus acidophilus]
MTDISPETPAGDAAAAQDESAPSEGREIELKFTLGEAGFAAALNAPLLRRDGDKDAPKKLVSVYYDTPDWDLLRQKTALRVRRSGRTPAVMTLKWRPEAESLFSRGEIEHRVRTLEPDITLFEGEPGDALRALIGDKPLVAKYETRIARTTRLLSCGAATVEAAFDEGEIVAGEKRLKLRELELELKSGPETDFYAFASKLASVLPLRLDAVSKAERASHLALGGAPTPVKAKIAALSGDLNLDAAIAQVILTTRDHFLSNWASLRESDDPESIHQMRVALRRLRAALAMFKRAVPCPEFEAFRARAKTLATAFGAARDCDVLRDLVETGPKPHFSENAFTPLLAVLERRRADAYAQARLLLESAEPTLFALDLGGFVARRGWRNALTAEGLSGLTGPVGAFASEALERLHKRALKRGRKLTSLPDELRHECRIALKNLRYGAEFFSGAFDGDAASDFIRATAHAQNILGAHNDVATAEHFLSEPHDEKATRAAGVVLGWHAREALTADEHLSKTWKGFRNAKPFWT